MLHDERMGESPPRIVMGRKNPASLIYERL